jgi:putative FmdB family regulatory protein
MPTYEYRCDACGHKFEKFQSITAASIRKCPNCGKNSVKRLIGTGAGLIFKGGGFYTTDYRSEAYKSAAKADSGASGGAKESTSTSSGDSTAKPAAEAKSDAKPAADTKPASDAKPASSTKAATKPVKAGK